MIDISKQYLVLNNRQKLICPPPPQGFYIIIPASSNPAQICLRFTLLLVSWKNYEYIFSSPPPIAMDKGRNVSLALFKQPIWENEKSEMRSLLLCLKKFTFCHNQPICKNYQYSWNCSNWYLKEINPKFFSEASGSP